MAGAFHVVRDRAGTDRAFCKAHDGPLDIAGLDPRFQFLPALDLAVVESEIETQRAADHSGCQFDQGDAVGAGNRPARRCGGETGQLVQLLAIELLGAFVRCVELEIAGDAFAKGAIVAVQHADRDHRSGAPIGNQSRHFGHKLDLCRRGREEYFAGETLGLFAEGIDHLRDEHRTFVDKRNAAPSAYGVAALLGIERAIEGQLVDRLAIHHQLDRLAATMTDGNADRRSARVGIDIRRQEAVFAITQRNPVGVGRQAGTCTGGFSFCNRHPIGDESLDACIECLARSDSLDRLRAGAIGARFRVFRHGSKCPFGNDGVEIGNLEAATLPNDEARARAACISGGPVTIDQFRTLGQGHLRHLHDMRSGYDPFEMIPSVGIGDGVAAVFQHDANTGNARARRLGVVQQSAGAGGYAADDRQAVGDIVPLDVDSGAGPCRAPEGIGYAGIVERAARRGIGADRHAVSYAALRSTGNIAQGDGKRAAIGR